MSKAHLTSARVRELLDYSHESGEFHWLQPRGANTPQGALAGTYTRAGRVRIGIDGANYPAEELAWLYVHGEWPAGKLRHVNGQTWDNRIENLTA